jgi:hypothetical protein
MDDGDRDDDYEKTSLPKSAALFEEDVKFGQFHLLHLLLIARPSIC